MRLLGMTTMLLLAVAGGCEGDDPQATEEGALDFDGEPVEPPFEVKGEAEGLMLVWFDEEGTHTASRRSEIPESHRERVRVDSLRLAPDERLDAAHVYVADLRSPKEDGSFPVRKIARDAFDALVDRAMGVAPRGEGETEVARAGEGEVILYMADWCGACAATARYFRQKNVTFVEKNIETDPGAAAEMRSKAQAAGISTTGIPVIDFRGTMIAGFDRSRLEQLID